MSARSPLVVPESVQGIEVPATSSLEVICQQAETDPRAAAQQIIRLPAGPERRAAINQIAILWANQDLSAAIAWVQALPDDADWQSAALNVAAEALPAEPVTALTLALDLPANPDRDILIAQSTAEWATTEPAAAAAWAKQISDTALRDRVLSNVATVWGDANPVAAAQFALAELPGGRAQDDALIGIVQRWAQTEPEAAGDWVAKFPAGSLRDTATANILTLTHLPEISPPSAATAPPAE